MGEQEERLVRNRQDAERQAADVIAMIRRRCAEILGAVFDAERTLAEAVPQMKAVWSGAMHEFWHRDYVDPNRDGVLWDEGPATTFRAEVARLAEITNVDEHDIL